MPVKQLNANRGRSTAMVTKWEEIWTESLIKNFFFLKNGRLVMFKYITNTVFWYLQNLKN